MEREEEILFVEKALRIYESFEHGSVNKAECIRAYQEWYAKASVLFNKYIDGNDKHLLKFESVDNSGNGYSLEENYKDIYASYCVLMEKVRTMNERRLSVVDIDDVEINITNIQAKIYQVRGTQVMLDRDLATFYNVETGQLNRQVKRNANRFPDDFMFQLTKEEWNSLKCQLGISNTRGGDRRSLPYVFTEQGVSQLSGVLRSDFAVEMSVKIIRAFVMMRRFITTNAGIFQRLSDLERKQINTDEKLDKVLNRIEELSPSITSEQLFPSGCVWDGYTFVCDLIRSAKTRIVLVDNYVDDRVLTMLDKRAEGVEAEVYTKYTEQVKLDFDKHNKQYVPISFTQIPHAVHDRYLIIDDEVWLLGTSMKDIGRSLSTIIKVGFSVEAIMKEVMK